MSKNFKYSVILVSLVIVGVLVFLQNRTGFFNLQTAVLPASEDHVAKVQPKSYFLSPFKMIPFVTHAQSRKNICALKIDGPIETICERRFNKVVARDSAKIDELFSILKEVNESGAPTEMAKYLTTQLVFSTLPKGTGSKTSALQSQSLQNSVLSSTLLAQSTFEPAFNPGITRGDYINQMQQDFNAVKSNCPQPGNENWVFNAMCSEYKWRGDVQEPIYSRQYSEYGGSCRSDAGQVEKTNIQSVVNTKMKGDYDFVDEAGVSSQIACSFSCASYQCPKFEESEIKRTQCENPIYYPFYTKNEIKDITGKDKVIAFDAAKTDCYSRSYEHVTNSNGSSSLKKVRNCKLNFNSDTSYFDPDFGRAVPMRTFCCSCARAEQDPYVSITDFSQPGYKDADWFKKIIDTVKEKIQDVLPQPPKDSDAPPLIPTPMATPATPVPASLPPSLPATSQPLKPPATSSQTPATTPAAAPAPAPVEQPQADNSNAYPNVLRFKYTCAITSSWWQNKIKDVRLTSVLTPIDENGNSTYVTPIGVSTMYGNSEDSCDNVGHVVPICVDPRTNEKTDGPIEFVKEYRNWTGKEESVKKEVRDMFDTMNAGQRGCRPDEAPRV